jgi:NO-binding membrane sensor protein with MHYT domain/two-component sensor histidine kinase
MSQIGAPLAGSYDYGEVARSIFIAIAASYAALDLGGRVTAARGWVRAAWLTCGAIAMGIGIWAMHFKALLAFRLPLTVDFHWPTILLSLGIGVFASAIALYVATRQKMGPVQAWTGSLIMGVGIAAMHYVGMAAMRMAAVTRFDPLLVALSVVLAILFSRIALMFTFDYREDFRGTTLAKVMSAAAMGAAISVMHYTGMAAVSFMPAVAFPNLSHTVSISPLGNNGIAIVTFLVLGTAILTSSVDRQAQEEVRRLNERLEQRIVERTKQLTAANEELRREIVERKQAEGEIQLLSGKLLRLQDEERRRIARDLHDSTGQDLVALATMLGQLRSSIPSADQKSKDRLSECNALADACIRDIRTLSYMLHSPVLDQAGLGDAIREYVDGFTKRSGIQVELELSLHLGRIARDVELALFRVVQESLTNAQCHSGSQQAKIRIDRGSSLILEISDGGRAALGKKLRGEDVLKFKAGVGILSMQERVKLIGGRLDIDSTACGTTVRVTVPLGGEEREKTAHSDR